MDLKSDHPFWLLKNGLLRSYPPLDRDQTCEVAILGGGITGAIIAESLTSAGVECVVLDCRDIGQGSTAATTALLQYEIDVHRVDLIKMVGKEPAERAYRLCIESIGKLADLVSQLPDTCGFERKQSIYLASAALDAGPLADEFQARRQMGISLELLDQAAVQARFNLTGSAALLSDEAAQVDAYRLTHRLFERNQARGLRVFDRTDVTDFEQLPTGVRLRTDRGFFVSARQIVFATGYEAQELLKQQVVTLKSTYAFVTQPIPGLSGWPRECLLWESSRPYIYLRSTDDERLLMGGEDDDFRNPKRRDANLSKKSKRLFNRFQQLLPDLKVEVEYAWAGTFGETKDGLAFIGATKEFPNAYFGLGFGGNGITFSVIAAEILRDLILGRENEDASIFRFDR